MTALAFAFERLSEGQLGGYVFDPDDLDRRFVVELWLDCLSVGLARAERFDEGLRARGFGDGGYRFVFTLPPDLLRTGRRAEVRLANSDARLGAALRLDAREPIAPRPRSEARWLGGLRVAGWTGAIEGEPPRIRAFVDETLVAEVRADLWRHVEVDGERRAARAFLLDLPQVFADGRARRVEIRNEDGEALAGSPIALIAFDDGLAAFLASRAEIASEVPRGEAFDRFFPQSLPFSQFDALRRSRREPAAPSPIRRVAVALIGESDAAATLDSLRAQTGCEWRAARIAPEGGQTSFRPEALALLLADVAQGCEAVVFALSGTLFDEQALFRLAEGLAAFPAAPCSYGDVTIADPRGAEWPIAFSAFDGERFLEQGYAGFAFAVRPDRALDAAQKGASSLFDVFLHDVDPLAAPEMAPIHVPGFLCRIPRPDIKDGSHRLANAALAHLERRGVEAAAVPAHGGLFPAVHIRRAPAPGLVSILIPNGDDAERLRSCLAALERTTGDVATEALVAVHGDDNPDRDALLREADPRKVRTVAIRGARSRARSLMAAASVARGRFLLLFDADVEATGDGWLEELLGRATAPDVGAVGPLLLRPSGVVASAGLTLGMKFAPADAFVQLRDGDAGYGDLLIGAHEVSALGEACLLTPRGGFLDAWEAFRFPHRFAAVDYCLKLRAKGLRVVAAPRARLTFHGPGGDEAPADTELNLLRLRWAEALSEDPCYSPLLSRDGYPYTALAWPPGPSAPRSRRAPPPREVLPGF